jgi:hypothetical protein
MERSVLLVYIAHLTDFSESIFAAYMEKQGPSLVESMMSKILPALQSQLKPNAAPPVSVVNRFAIAESPLPSSPNGDLTTPVMQVDAGVSSLSPER